MIPQRRSAEHSHAEPHVRTHARHSVRGLAGDLRCGSEAEPEDGAETGDAAGGGRAVETAIRALDQRGGRMGAGIEAVQRGETGERARGRDAEDRAVAGRSSRSHSRSVAISRAIEITVAALDESRARISTVAETVIKRIKGAQLARGRDSENRAVEVIAGDGVALGHAVGIAIRALDQRAHGRIAIRAAGERVKRGERAAGRQLENSSEPERAASGQAVEIAAAALNQCANRRITVRAAGERVKVGEHALEGHFEDLPVGRTLCGAVEIVVRAPHQRRIRASAFGFARERVKRGERAVGGHLEHSAPGLCATVTGRAVQIAIRALCQRSERSVAIRAAPE